MYNTQKTFLTKNLYMPGDNREWELPETIPNSEVKTFFANDSMVFHVKVGHCQVFFAGVAQLVEQLICNQQVTGSSPVSSYE